MCKQGERAIGWRPTGGALTDGGGRIASETARSSFPFGDVAVEYEERGERRGRYSRSTESGQRDARSREPASSERADQRDGHPHPATSGRSPFATRWERGRGFDSLCRGSVDRAERRVSSGMPRIEIEAYDPDGAVSMNRMSRRTRDDLSPSRSILRLLAAVARPIGIYRREARRRGGARRYFARTRARRQRPATRFRTHAEGCFENRLTGRCPDSCALRRAGRGFARRIPGRPADYIAFAPVASRAA
jgi:hypothetical protein